MSLATNKDNGRHRRRVAVVVMIVTVALGGLWWLTRPPSPPVPPAPPSAEIPTATSTATITPVPPIVVQTLSTATLYTGPGTAYDVLVQLLSPTEFTITGRDEDGEWLLVCCIADQEAWLSIADVSTLSNMQLLPVITAAAPLPVNTPTPTQPFFPTATPSPIPIPWGYAEAFGLSVEQRVLTAYRFGTGRVHIALVGGIHGGYEINTIELMDLALQHYMNTPSEVPDQVTLWIIPSLNPDGEAKYRNDSAVQANSLPARPNARNVDLNRNFDCAWQEFSMHQDRQVWAGSGPFSEPETIALRNFVFANNIDSLIFYHSQGRWVEDGVCAEASPLVQQYGQAVAVALDFPFYSSGSTYDVTGDAPGYFNSIGIATLAIELTNHEVPEWETQRHGMAAALAWVAVNLE